MELEGDNPGVWMFHCHMENHAANGMMTLIQYDGAIPTGPVAEFFDPEAGVAPDGSDHLHGAPDPSSSTPTVEPAIGLPTAESEPSQLLVMSSRSPCSMIASTRRT